MRYCFFCSLNNLRTYNIFIISEPPIRLFDELKGSFFFRSGEGLPTLNTPPPSYLRHRSQQYFKCLCILKYRIVLSF